MIDYIEIIKNNMNECLRRKGLSQRDLARLLGMYPSQISRIFQGKAGTTIAMLVRIAQALEVSPASLLVQKDEDIESTVHPIEECLRRVSQRVTHPPQEALTIRKALDFLRKVAEVADRGELERLLKTFPKDPKSAKG